MLFDEPTSALDPERVGEVLETIRTLALSGVTMVVVTHETGFARQVADRVVFMAEGKIVEAGSAERVLNRPAHPRSAFCSGCCKRLIPVFMEKHRIHQVVTELARQREKEAAKKASAERETLSKTSGLIADVGDRMGEYLGDKYKSLANEIANDIKNFQGKNIRSYDQAMASLSRK